VEKKTERWTNAKSLIENNRRMVRFRYYEDILEIYNRYTEDISQDILEMFWVYQIWSLYSQWRSSLYSMFILRIYENDILLRCYIYECFTYIRYDHSILRISIEYSYDIWCYLDMYIYIYTYIHPYIYVYIYIIYKTYLFFYENLLWPSSTYPAQEWEIKQPS